MVRMALAAAVILALASSGVNAQSTEGQPPGAQPSEMQPPGAPLPEPRSLGRRPPERGRRRRRHFRRNASRTWRSSAARCGRVEDA
jgi:hypothetical protein